MKTINRKKLLRALQILKPALATEDFILIAKCFCFREKYVFAFNNVLAILWPFKSEIVGGIPGEVFLRMVSSMTSKEVEIEQDEDSINFVSAGTKFESPIFPKQKFLIDDFKVVEAKGSIPVDKDFFDGLESCLISVGTNVMQPQHQGISVVIANKKVSLYSTDNVTLSRYSYPTKKSKTKMEVILPIDFCKQLLAMQSHLEDSVIDFHSDYVGVRTQKIFAGKRYVIFSKRYVGELSLFENVMEDYYKKENEEAGAFFLIEKSFEDCLERSLMVLGSDPDKKTTLVLTKKGVKFLTKSRISGTVLSDKYSTKINAALPKDGRTLIIDPGFALRGCKTNGNKNVTFGKTAMMFKSQEKDFIHLLALMNPPEEK